MAFSEAVVREVAKVAKANRIELAALMAVVECESNGQPLEPADGKTPRLLFERHVFYRELKKRQPGKLGRAVSAGLAIPKWSRSTQYKDQATSKGRLNVIARARAIDEECANRSASWGVGQTMGFLAEEQGFANANAMLKYMVDGGVPAQVDCMVRECRRKGLIKYLNNHQWASFARVYNGPGYAANSYDTRMAAAYRRWVSALPRMRLDDPATPPPPDIQAPKKVPQSPPVAPDEPIDIPPNRNGEDTKPIVKSKTVWASIGGILSTVAAFATDWRVLTVVVVGFFLFIIADRYLKLDIKGWFR